MADGDFSNPEVWLEQQHRQQLDPHTSPYAHAAPTEKGKGMPRHHFPGFARIRRLVRQGNVVQAMTEFYAATAPQAVYRQGPSSDAKLDVHIVNDMLHQLAATAMLPAHRLKNWRQSVQSDRLWIPPQLGGREGEIENVIAMRPQILAIYALASVYDIAALHHVLPSGPSSAMMLRAFWRYLDHNTFAQTVSLVLLTLNGMPVHEAQLLAGTEPLLLRARCAAHTVPVEVIQALIEGFGAHQRIGVAEKILAWWLEGRLSSTTRSSVERRAIENTADASTRRLLLQKIPAEQWPADGRLWRSLIQATSALDDLAASRSWLLHYRRVSAAHGWANLDEKTRCAATAPYLEYLRRCTAAGGDSLRAMEDIAPNTDTGMEIRREALAEVIRMMQDDMVPLDMNVFSLVLSFQVGTGHLEQAADIASSFLDGDRAAKSSPSLYCALFRLHAKWAIHHPESKGGAFGVPILDGRDGRSSSYKTARTLFCSLLSRKSFDATWKPQQRLDALNSALAAALAQDDMPLALAVTTILSQLRIARSNENTWRVATTWLRRRGKLSAAQPSHGFDRTVMGKWMVRRQDAHNDRNTIEKMYREDLVARGVAIETHKVTTPPTGGVAADETLENDSMGEGNSEDKLHPFLSDNLDSGEKLHMLRDMIVDEMLFVMCGDNNRQLPGSVSDLQSNDSCKQAPTAAWNLSVRFDLGAGVYTSTDTNAKAAVVRESLRAFLLDDAGRCRVARLRHLVE